MNKTSKTLKGFRDFLPEEKRKRDFVAAKIKQSFELFGFEPLETPTLEYADLLLGKYGDEADKLVYTFEDRGGRRVGLRYDQTVPSARVLSQYQDKLPKFFRRYQIQNVFRADKPQKGRYREFTQCDIDIFGSTDPVADAEIIACTYAAYKNIGFNNPQLLINDRQVLISTLSPFATDQVNLNSIIQTIDKLDKMSPDQVRNELVNKGLAPDPATNALEALKQVGPSDNLNQILELLPELGVNPNDFRFSPTTARGLDYYTGMIFEVIIPEFTAGSLGGGGRYDNLIKNLGGPDLPAVGMAFGFDRTVEAADQLGLIPAQKSTSQVMVTVFNETLQPKSLEIASALRQVGINTELYPNLDKMDKQLKTANQKNIPFVIIVGEQEINQNQVSLKNMATGDQQTLTIKEAIEKLSS